AQSGLLFEGMLADGAAASQEPPQAKPAQGELAQEEPAPGELVEEEPLLGSLPPASPRVAAPMMLPDNPEVDPFDTSSAAALSADIFAGAFDDGGAVGAGLAPGGDSGSTFDESPSNSGVKAAATAAEPAAPPPAAVPAAVPASAPVALPPAASPAPEPRRRKPARLKLHYREKDSFVAEYRDNLRRGGTFIKTEKPLAVGRECVFEIDAPGLVEPLVFEGVVTMVNTGDDGETPGMAVDYRMDPSTLRRVEQALDRL
ncbi:MAG: hypothetical protein FJ102_16280, partial [Deltaproteobacteria bacterium]|nr:hypothetical protein [Deltaproteobacteria bacterium]